MLHGAIAKKRPYYSKSDKPIKAKRVKLKTFMIKNDLKCKRYFVLTIYLGPYSKGLAAMCRWQIGDAQ